VKKTLRVLPLLLSLLLLLGHQLVPHLHEAPAEEVSIGAPQSSHLGWLSLVFSLDQGAEHLEHYRQMSGNELQPDLQELVLPSFIAMPLLLPQAAKSSPPFFPFSLSTSSNFIARAHQLRGPPSC
jgi:hypothetical protein